MNSDKDALLDQLRIDADDRHGDTPGSSRRWIFLGCAALILIAFGAYMGLLPGLNTGADDPRNSPQSIDDITAAADTPQTAAPAPLPPATVAATTQAPPSDAVLNASGYVVARRIATVSAQLTGLITEVLVEEGLEVAEGQVLARLDDAVARVNLSLAEAQTEVNKGTIQRIEAALAEAKRVLDRTARLKDNDFSTEAALTRAQADVQSLSAQLIEARATLKVAEFEAARQRETVDDHIIRAPFAGVVIDKSAQPGEIISPVSAGGGFTRTGICTIVDMASLEVEVDVNEAFISRVTARQRVRATLDAYPDWDIPANVIAIVPTADRTKATVRVRIGLESRDPRILPDMGIKVAFLAPQS